MNNMKHKILMTLALLLTAATGAWAQWTGGTYTATTNEELGAITVGADATLTINEGVTVTVSGGINANGHTLTVNGAGTLTVTGTNGTNGANSSEYDGGGGGNGSAGFTGTLIVDGATVNVTGGNGGNGGSGFQYGGSGGNGAAGVSGSITLNSGSATITGGAGGNGGSAMMLGGSRGKAGQAVTETITASTAEESDDNSTWTAISGNTSSKRYLRADSTVPAVEVTINDAKTEASFQMPQYDVTATYTIKRDISVDVTATMGDGTDGVRYRVKKSEQVPGKYEPAEMDMMQVLALVAVNDAIEQKTLTQTQDYFCRIYKLDEQTKEPAGDGVELYDFDFAPGLYALKAFAEKGSNYAGETALSNTFQLFQGYQVEVAAKEFITYYKDEPLYADTETSADAELYTISSVSADQATLSAAIETAPSRTPLLIFNNSDEAKTFLLIPANAEPHLQLTVAPEFVGTLEATTIAASTDDQTNYALNGKAFVFVKNAIEVGPNKAWLSVNTGVPSARITLVFDETTKITNTNITNIANGEWYTIDGRKVNAPTKKGIYIMNGKKVVVK